jgi:YidC/Oxa1 family membrane protein insertase
MEKRFLLAFVLSLLVLVSFQLYFEKKLKPLTTSKQSLTPAGPNDSLPKATPTHPPTTREEPQKEKSSAPQESTPVVAEGEKDVVLENSLVKIVLSNQGAVVKSWVLKSYKDSSRQVLDLVAGVEKTPDTFPLQVTIPEDADLTRRINSALFVDSLLDEKKPAGDAGASVRLRYSENGIDIEKTLRISGNSYLAELRIRATKDGSPVPFLVSWPARFGDNALEMSEDARDVVTAVEEKTKKSSLVKVKGTQDLTEGYKSAGVEDRYFAAMFLPSTPIRRIQFSQAGALFSLSDQSLRLFVGPKEIEILRRVDPQLESLVDFGWFGIIGKPLFLALRWIYGYCRNYGLAVILLTIVINMALFPLRWKSMISAQKMQKLQPKIKSIQERYKKYKVNDPKKQEMNQEMMALYKEHGVNPLGGCLPMLLQMPILIAFYNVLNVAIDLRQVSFLWIPDLSQHDKTFILVVIMVITQFIMQKMTPSPSSDPAQAKMFMLMPLVFGFMFAKVASGLVLYWLTGNVIGIIQQVFLNRRGLAVPVASSSGKPAKGKTSVP